MSEKTVVTIDCGLVVPEGDEKVFENQHIRLEAGIESKGTLIFKNCTIEPCAKLDGKSGGKLPYKPGCIRMGINGKLRMDGCEVIHPGQDFLSGWNMAVQNTSFLISPGADGVVTVLSIAPCVIAAHGEARFHNCSFVEEGENTSHASTLALVCFNRASMENCTFKNIQGKIEVAAIMDCSFVGCAAINGTKIIDSTFTDCGSISADGGYVKGCDFIHVKSIFATSSDMDSCKFQKLRGDVEDDGVISLEDCKITHCSFDDVELRNGAYLIDGVGTVSIEYCRFADCRTDREDLAICCGKVVTGKLRKQCVKVDILDVVTCSGHDKVQQLD